MDGFSETYWNGIQLLGWVYLGDREFVRRASDGFNDHGTFWQQLSLPDGRKEFVETPANPPELITLSLTAAWKRGAAYPSFNDAREAVLITLQEGKLHAWGLENGEGNLKKIPAVQWAKLDFYQDNKHRIYASPDDHFRPGATKWHGLKFERAEVLEIWPDPLENLPRVITAQPLEPLSEDHLDALLKLDAWTLTEALYVLHGYKALGYESTEQLMSHFPSAYNYARNSIISGNLCQEKRLAGERVFIESPARWFDWALKKGLPVADMVRAKMGPAGKDKARGKKWPQGSRSFGESDAPLLSEMADMLSKNDWLSVWTAAGEVASKAKGGGTLESRRKRLARRYRLQRGDTQR